MGYEGQDVESFVRALTTTGVGTLVDVRLTPISRKRGFSKRALGAVLADAGIEYRHLRSLGNPKANRPGFAGTERELFEARERYGQLIRTPEAGAALDELARLARNGLVAVMCFEADERRCHRDVVLGELHQRLRPVGLHG
ncbi:Protein of unknown function, DUF488 [Streptoalloteichus tenebrarius]|uniref:DUF488 domain-containing protein n=1 Tax=Streptoalloteichus tenebrarius (strain ATCC 17920 / DSM 40477 / JCM 4838 / CBS 697.72 / NBRC 16177 / NCIMB 11028 / NRRL B-12390 / A12253. 1 / ISP 5477) TaxID=1933 RepID=A0ABT1HW56_STRSD|nr:Protein of unknown function, DUF488 [Streptoalloteichus tenebrarius]BFF00733.1 hypothetical protein GCM10020241_24080 [Streptoalloteichus tenebrarius]